MKHKFKFNLEVLESYKSAVTVRQVVNAMGGLAVEKFPLYEKSKSSSIAQHRINEIEKCADFGTNYCGATWYIKHHTNQAIETLNSHQNQWEINAPHLGRINPFERTQKFIKASRDRMDPVFYALEKELDPNKSARLEYDVFEYYWLHQSELQNSKYKESNLDANSYRKKNLRKSAIASARIPLIGFCKELTQWSTEIEIYL